jgi:hypothetical protein
MVDQGSRRSDDATKNTGNAGFWICTLLAVLVVLFVIDEWVSTPRLHSTTEFQVIEG